jgi:uncharacterized protein (UPF0335 family)
MSVQLDRYLAERAVGSSIEDACFVSGIDAAEAKLIEQAIAKGELELPHAGAHVHVHEGGQSTEGSMENVTTTMRINGGPEIPVSLDDANAPENAAAKAAIGEMFQNPATDTGQRLKLFIERAERLDAEIRDLNEDKSEVFKEAKNDGFDTKAIKQIIKLRKMKPHERQTQEAVLQTYMDALGMTPIEAAIALAA